LKYATKVTTFALRSATVVKRVSTREVAEPEIHAKAVAGDGFDAAVFAVGIRVMNGAVDRSFRLARTHREQDSR
jgi:hypothetical protein